MDEMSVVLASPRLLLCSTPLIQRSVGTISSVQRRARQVELSVASSFPVQREEQMLVSSDQILFCRVHRSRHRQRWRIRGQFGTTSQSRRCRPRTRDGEMA